MVCPRCRRIVDAGDFCNLCGLPFAAPPSGRPPTSDQWPPPHRPVADHQNRASGYQQTDHTRYLATAHRIYGGCSAVLIIGPFLFALGASLFLRVAWPLYLERLIHKTLGVKLSLVQYDELVSIVLSLLFIVLVNLACTVPFFAVAHGLRRQRGWTKLVAVVTVLLSILVFPFGTALSVYTMWYFFAGPGRAGVLQ